jgi:hypothetical protein
VQYIGLGVPALQLYSWFSLLLASCYGLFSLRVFLIDVSPCLLGKLDPILLECIGWLCFVKS